MKMPITTFVFVILVVLVVSSVVYAQPYYADITAKLDDKGTVTFEGTTNYLPFNSTSSDAYTEKIGNYWVINITTPENFSDYVLDVQFPQGAEINAITTGGTFRIVDDQVLHIVNSGSGSAIHFVVKYEIKPEVTQNQIYLLAILVGVLILFIVLLIMYRKLQKLLTVTKLETHKLHDQVKMKVLWPTLTENQKVIMQLILQAKEPLTQKQLMHRSKLPKATLSRNIDILTRKNILVKQSRGLTNVITVHDSLVKI